MWAFNALGKKAFREDACFSELNEEKMDVIIFPNRKWPRMGLVLGQEALILDYRTFMSFRVRSGNLGFSKDIHFRKTKIPLNRKFLKKYFQDNQDNPYGLYNIMRLIHSGRDIVEATQFPPLNIPVLTSNERKRTLEKLISVARKGDQIFSTNRNGTISSVIRKYDHSQFSHVALYLGNGEVFDIGPDGGTINSLFNSNENTHFALYTFKKDVPEEIREKLATRVRNDALKKIDFNYIGLFLMFLRKKFKIPIVSNIPSVADLLYSNSFDLVAYL